MDSSSSPSLSRARSKFVALAMTLSNEREALGTIRFGRFTDTRPNLFPFEIGNRLGEKLSHVRIKQKRLTTNKDRDAIA